MTFASSKTRQREYHFVIIRKTPESSLIYRPKNKDGNFTHGTGTRGYRTHMSMVWAQIHTHG
jgi:hypothetical protein